jgi:hypothetical protein
LDSCSGRRSLLGICQGQRPSGRWLTIICSNRRAKRAPLIYLLLNFVRRFPLDFFLAGKFEFFEFLWKLNFLEFFGIFPKFPGNLKISWNFFKNLFSWNFLYLQFFFGKFRKI